MVALALRWLVEIGTILTVTLIAPPPGTTVVEVNVPASLVTLALMILTAPTVITCVEAFVGDVAGATLMGSGSRAGQTIGGLGVSVKAGVFVGVTVAPAPRVRV